MAVITESGYYSDNLGRPFLVTQGLVGYTLVDRKKILFRIFISPNLLNPVTSVSVRIKYIGTNIPPTDILIPRSDLLIENSFPNGPSIGIVFEGDVFPNAAIRYYIEFNALAENPPRIMARLVIPELRFRESGRLRVLAKNLIGTAPWGNKIEADLGWFIEILFSLFRFSAMLPISDGFVIGPLEPNNRPEIGFAWSGGEPVDTWPNPCPSGNPPSIPDARFPNVLRCPGSEMNNFLIAEAKQLRSQGFRIDTTVAWRPRDYAKFPPPGGENPGGQSPFGVNTAPANRLATVVGGSRNVGGADVYYTAPIIAQEVGHTLGLEPTGSPHYDGGSHSKDPFLIDPFAFDFVHLRPYFPPPQGASYLGDVMSYAWSQGMDSTLFNAYDWEYLRQRLVQISALALAPKDLAESRKKKKLVEEIQTPFTKLQKIRVKDPEATLSSKPGFEWHWTRNGFQRLVEEKPKRNKSGFAPSAEMILSGLRELDVKEIYVPMDGKPLTIIVTAPPVTDYTDGVRSSGLP